ncbi:MAG: hypothetical protein ACD_59C00130G0007 [uncultured bacterium]|nr:MAG: hypothetical protein ACD_59C00130G0007 [uncultured bacterium]
MINLSVIIPTRNRSSLLTNTLESILLQNYPQTDFEVIVIDNGSTDSTAEICNIYSTKFINFVYLYDEHPGLHVGRHLGLKNARAENLVYADDDIKAFPTWLEGIAESFQENNVMVGGKCLPEYEIEPPEWMKYLWNKSGVGKTNSYYSLIDLGDIKKEIDPMLVIGCNLSIKKNVVMHAGGFHPDSMPKEKLKYRGDGESGLAIKLKEKGYSAIYNPKASIYHFVSKHRLTKEYLYQRAFLHGITNSYHYTRNKRGYISQINFKTVVNTLKAHLKDIKFRLFNNEVYNIIKKGYREGYEFHQKEMLNDIHLIDWVLKENYFDD